MLSLFKVDYILHEKEYYTSLGFLYVPKIIDLEAPKFKLVFPLKSNVRIEIDLNALSVKLHLRYKKYVNFFYLHI